MVVAKGLSNGHPLSAVVAKESVFDEYMKRNKFVFFTYGANPLSCVAAAETLSIIEDDKIQDHALTLGKHLGKQLDMINNKYADLCVDVRGEGLMRGIELDAKFAASIYETMKDRHILVGLGGQKKNVLRVMPPMALNEADVDHFIETLDEVMCDYEKNM